MYVPDHFAESRPEALHELIRACPLGALITHGSAGLEATGDPRAAAMAKVVRERSS